MCGGPARTAPLRVHAVSATVNKKAAQKVRTA
jgi:hypothetical protein